MSTLELIEARSRRGLRGVDPEDLLEGRDGARTVAGGHLEVGEAMEVSGVAPIEPGRRAVLCERSLGVAEAIEHVAELRVRRGVVGARAQGAGVYDFWGAPDVFDESDRLWGVWRFKAGFNGEVVRFIGAWDYTSRPLLYRLYTQAIPRYLDRLRSRRGRPSGELTG